MSLIPEDKVFITVATTGGVVGMREKNPNLPEQPDEIARAVYEAWNEGACQLHLHARDKNGLPTGDPAVYSDIHRKIRELGCDIIIQDTTGTGATVLREDRIKCLEADPKPEVASLDLGTMVRSFGPYAGTGDLVYAKHFEDWAIKMKNAGVKASMEVFNDSHVREVRNLINKGLVDKPYFVELALGHGYHGGIEANPYHLWYLLHDLPALEDTVWSVMGVGKDELTITTMGMLLGGCVRVGFEDNLYYSHGELAKSNAQLVGRVVRIAHELGKEPLKPEEARKILGLKPLAMNVKRK